MTSVHIQNVVRTRIVESKVFQKRTDLNASNYTLLKNVTYKFTTLCSYQPVICPYAETQELSQRRPIPFLSD